jgi:hypothetical protein
MHNKNSEFEKCYNLHKGKTHLDTTHALTKKLMHKHGWDTTNYAQLHAKNVVSSSQCAFKKMKYIPCRFMHCLDAMWFNYN